MSEIVYSHVEKHPGVTDADLEYGRKATDLKTTIWVSPDKVNLVFSALVIGMNHKAKKRYYKWRTIQSLGFYRNRAGRPQAYHCTRPYDFRKSTPWTNQMAEQPFNMLKWEDETGKIFRHYMWQSFDVGSLGDIYPIADMYGLHSYKYLPYSLRPAMRQPDWKTFATKAFGKKRTNDRLVAAVQNTEPYVVALGQQFRGLVPDNEVVAFMENTQFDDDMLEYFKPHSPNVRYLIMQMNEKSRSTLLARGLDLEDTDLIKKMIPNRHLDRSKDYTAWKQLAGWW